jgi:high affinity sulfate transporter 1
LAFSLKLISAVPISQVLSSYQPDWLPKDLIAGVSVAAVQIPTAVAYAQLAGFPPQVGLYSSVLPLVAYALFGSSRQLVVGPDSGTCAMLAATLAPLAAGGGPDRFAQLSVAICFVGGLLCLMAALLRCNFVADFLSEPILIGFMNGLGLNIAVSQIGKIFGVPTTQTRFWSMLIDSIKSLPKFHPLTTALGLGLLFALVALKWRWPRAPGALIAVLIGLIAGSIWDLGNHGVQLLGPIPQGFQPPHWPNLHWRDWEDLVPGAVGIVLVSYCNLALAARSFARRAGYETDSNQDFRALGIADICSGLSGGFMVSSGNSQTAIAIGVGGKTQIANLVGAAAIALVVQFATGPLAALPIAALGAILVVSGIGLLDIGGLRRLYRWSKSEFALSLVATFGVLTFGVFRGIFLAVGLAIIRILSQISRPNEAIVGKIPGIDGYNDIAGHPNAETLPGVLIYRFDAPILFFNADWFRRRLIQLIDTAADPLHTVIIDMESSQLTDTTGADALARVFDRTRADGIGLKLCRVRMAVRHVLQHTGLLNTIGEENFYPSIRSAAEAAISERAGAGEGGGERGSMR